LASVGTIVVGVDGSEGSLAALRFALDEARLRRGRLRVVHAFVLPLANVTPDPFLLEFPSVPGPELEQIATDLERSAQSLIDDALDRIAPGGDPGVVVERRALEGSPATALIDEACDADLLVVGTRGHGRVHDLLLGSVSQHCISRAPCPIAVVPAAASPR
jgi:nucleotide-binding universal stress UspA family protein